ncbi:MAG: hypothetical protein LBS30_01795, partial [Planctomycetota bacterium]|nr:hypothetical protein [Planctomycetota bacterium]
SDMQFSQMYVWQREKDYSRIPADLAFDSQTPQQMIAFLTGCGYQDRGMTTTNPGRHWHHVDTGATSESVVSWWEPDYNYVVKECLYACDMGWAGNVKEALWKNIEKFLEDYDEGLPRTRLTTLAWSPVPGATRYRVYRERARDGETGFSLIGETTAPGFRDSDLPALSTAIPVESDKFAGIDDYPGVCAFFEQRLILGRTNNKPTTFWGSDTGQYNAFTRHTPVEDSDSYEFTLASGEMNEIHWIVPLNDMLLGTSGGEWKAGGGGSAITPSSINARVQSWYGCSPLPPVVAGRTVIFAGRGRRTIRNFSYSLEADGYSGRDLTSYASHLFANREISCMCHQQEPSGIVWVVMSDGALLSCTYAPEEDVVSWSRHETRGRFEACGSLVDIDGTDQVYFCVAREINGVTRRFIETLEEPADRVRDESEGFFLDCGLTYRGSAIGRVTGLDHLEGESVSCLADGNVFTDLPVENGAVALPDGFTASVIHAGLPYTAELVTLELEPGDADSIRNRARFAVSAAVRLSRSRECLYSHSDGNLSEMKFRTTELPGRPARLFSGEKNIVFSSPPGARTTRLRFVSETPTPFTILGIIAEASCGQPA